MADRIKKFLRKLDKKQLEHLLPYVDKIQMNKVAGLDVKPLKGHKNVYRVRIGRYRVVFSSDGRDSATILFIGFRDDQTYRDF